jgi:hypothetical protein
MRRPPTRPLFFAIVVALVALLLLAFQLAGSPAAPARAAGVSAAR